MQLIPVGRPVYDLQTSLRLLSRADPDLPSVTPDGVYGAETKNAVTAFQQKHGLPSTGEADEATWNAIREEFRIHQNLRTAPNLLAAFPGGSITIEPGSTADVVLIIQVILRAISRVFLDFTTLSITGVYDPPTQQEIRRFQRRVRLPETGNTDKLTWDQLANAYRIVQQENIFFD